MLPNLLILLTNTSKKLGYRILQDISTQAKKTTWTEDGLLVVTICE